MKAHKLQMRVVSLKIKQTTSFFVLVPCVWAMFWVDRVKDGFKRKPVPDPILRIHLFHCCPRQRKAWCFWAVILVFTSCSSLKVRAGASSRSRPWPGGQFVQQWLVLLLPWPSSQLTTSSQVLEWILTKIRGLLWTPPSSGGFESVNMLFFGSVAAVHGTTGNMTFDRKTDFWHITQHERIWQDAVSLSCLHTYETYASLAVNCRLKACVTKACERRCRHSTLLHVFSLLKECSLAVLIDVLEDSHCRDSSTGVPNARASVWWPHSYHNIPVVNSHLHMYRYTDEWMDQTSDGLSCQSWWGWLHWTSGPRAVGI